MNFSRVKQAGVKQAAIKQTFVKICGYFLCFLALIGCAQKPLVTPKQTETRTIYIYNDAGTAKTCIENCKRALLAGPHAYHIKEINAQQTISGEWRADAAAFIMPGGADLPYCEKLNGAGNAQIKGYVEAGGTYIGFCAGAYYGSHECEFHKGDTRGYEVLGRRELSFFPGSAVGPVLAPYDYQSKSGTRIAKIKWYDEGANEAALNEGGSQLYNVYFNGGCYFKDTDQYPHVRVLATYTNERFNGLAAIVECTVGLGKALLSGVHPEFSAEDLKQEGRNLSAADQKHLATNITPYLQDCSHKILFNLLIKRIK